MGRNTVSSVRRIRKKQVMAMSKQRKNTTLLLKVIVVFSALIGIVLSAFGGRDSFMGGRTVFMYFTIQSNIAIAVICAIGAYLLIKNAEIPAVWFLIKFVGTVAITLTGVVFCFVLAPTMGILAWNIQNILTHVVVPVAAVADFFVTGLYGSFRRSDALFVTIPPLVYVIYAGIGYVRNWQFGPGFNFPYFFLNWGHPIGVMGFSRQFPFMGTIWWILFLLVFLLAVGRLYLSIVMKAKEREGIHEQ